MILSVTKTQFLSCRPSCEKFTSLLFGIYDPFVQCCPWCAKALRVIFVTKFQCTLKLNEINNWCASRSREQTSIIQVVFNVNFTIRFLARIKKLSYPSQPLKVSVAYLYIFYFLSFLKRKKNSLKTE